MGTNYIAPMWRMPRNANKDKLSNYSIGSFADGSTSSISTDLDLSSYNSFSISTWVKADTLGSGKTVCAQYRSGSSFSNSSWLLYVEAPGGTPYMTFYIFSGGSAILAGKNTVLSTDEWYHIVATWDGSTSKLYINGSKETTEGTVSSINTSIVNTLIGASNDSAGTSTTGFWDGYISQTSIFNYALSSNQVNYLYNLNNPMVISGGEPIAYWPLGDNSNPTSNAGYPNISVGADSVFDFNGSQAIDVPAVDLGVNGSISIWFNPETGGVADFVLVGEGSQGFDYVIRRSSGVFIIWIGSTFYQFAGFGSNVVTGGWNFLVLTKSAGNVNLYLKNSNGEFSVSRTESNWASASLKFDRIGARTITPINLGFQGEISNFQAWDSVLLSTEITTLYNNGQPLMTGTQPQEANLQVWYKLNQHDSYWDLGGNGKWTFNNAATN